jgi:hypothetical protein
MNQIRSYLMVGLLAVMPIKAFADTPDLAALQALVENYVSETMTKEVDDLTAQYDQLKYGDTYSADSPKMGSTDSEGNADTSWTKKPYDNMSASQLIGYTSDMCANHTAYDQLVAKGVKVDQAKFTAMRDKFCKLVKAAAEMKHRYDKYQNIKENGVVLAKRSKSQEHDFNGHHRTFGGGMELLYKPDLANTLKTGIHPDETLVYNSWIKWSDDKPTPLNIIKKIREMNNSGATTCDGFGFHIIDGKEVDGYLYLNVVNVTSSKITIQNCIKAHYNKTSKGHAFPPISMTAPFGYLYELEQMKDSAKTKLKDKVKDKVTSMIGANQQMIDLLKKISAAM